MYTTEEITNNKSINNENRRNYAEKFQWTVFQNQY